MIREQAVQGKDVLPAPVLHVSHLAMIGCLGGRGRAGRKRTLVREAEHQQVVMMLSPSLYHQWLLHHLLTGKLKCQLKLLLSSRVINPLLTWLVWPMLGILLLAGMLQTISRGMLENGFTNQKPSPVLPLTAVQCTTSPSFASHIQET